MNKLVSVIIPTYSRPEYITRAIESVLKQSYGPIEIIVVDDNGRNTENQLATEAILSSFIKSKKIPVIDCITCTIPLALRTLSFHKSSR